MPQPYDLTGIAAVQTTVAQMLADQRTGTVKFTGGYITWIENPLGQFKAIFSSGGTPAPTSTNLVRISLRQVRTTLDLIASGCGSSAANAVQSVTAALAAIAQSVTGGAATVANTNYDLSGIAALQTTVNQMLADQQSATTAFVGNARFTATLSAGQAAQSVTIATVVALYAALQANFDLLEQ